MTREQLDRLRFSTKAFRDAVRRLAKARQEAREAMVNREARARELVEDLRQSDIEEGLGFEHAGIVVWYETGDDPEYRSALHHVFLAYFREQTR